MSTNISSVCPRVMNRAGESDPLDLNLTVQIVSLFYFNETPPKRIYSSNEDWGLKIWTVKFQYNSSNFLTLLQSDSLHSRGDGCLIGNFLEIQHAKSIPQYFGKKISLIVIKISPKFEVPMLSIYLVSFFFPLH